MTPTKTTDKTATGTKAAARSTRKRATAKHPDGKLDRVERPPAGGKYPDDVREKVTKAIDDRGIAAVHHETGIPKGTLVGWAKAAGVDVGKVARARTAGATAAVVAATAEAAVGTLKRLEAILERELATHAILAGLEGRAAELMAGAREAILNGERVVEAQLGAFGVPYLVLQRPDSELGQLLGLIELTKGLSKRDVVGSWTRAIHDLQLLRGEATERGDLIVRFGNFPRPDAAASDAAAVDQDKLAIEAPK